MVLLCLRRTIFKVAVFVLVLESSNGLPQWPTGEEKSLLPFLLDIPGEELKLYTDVYTLLKNALMEYKKSSEIKDDTKSSDDKFDFATRLQPSDFSEGPRASLTAPLEIGSKFWDDIFEKRVKTSSYDNDDLIVNKKRGEFQSICQKGSVFGSWVERVCNTRSG